MKEAWVTIPAEDEVRAVRAERSPYDIEFVPAMGRHGSRRWLFARQRFLQR